MGITRSNGIRAVSASNSVFSTGTVRITGGPNITVGTDASGISISGANPGAGGGIALAGSNTTYTSGTVTLTGVANITVSSNTGQRIDLSVPAGATATGNLGSIVASNATISSGGVTLTGAGQATVNTAAGPIIQVSVPAGASATGNLGAIIASDATITSGSVTFTGAGAATVNTAAGPIVRVSVPVQTAQTGISSIAASNTTYTSGGITITGSNSATVRSTTGQGIVIDVSQTVQTQNVHNVTLSGNTSGAMAHISSGTMTLAGGNNITLSQNGNAVTISAGAGGGAGFSAGASTGGNTAGATGITGTQLVLVGSDNITLSQTTGANGGTVSIIGPSPGAAQFSVGVSTGGNTAGSTGVTGTRIVYVGTNNITLSQSTDATGATISISAPNTTVQTDHTWSYFNPQDAYVQVAGQQGQGSMHIQPMQAPTLTFDRIAMPIIASWATNSTCSATLSMGVGLYTRSASTLSLASSWSTSTNGTFSGTANSSLFSGMRLLTIDATGLIDNGQYWVGVWSRTTSGGANMSFSQMLASQINSNFSGIFGVSTTNTLQYTRGLGSYSATFSTELPSAVAFSEIRGAGASIVLRQPIIYAVLGTV